MFDSNRTLPHLPFFEELAQTQETDSAWKETTAGLVTLRLIDSWIEEGTHVASEDSWSGAAVREAIQNVDRGSIIRGLLEGITDMVLSLGVVDMHVVSPRLLAYARALDLQSKWALAADVYRSIIRHSSPAEHSDSVITAHTRLGFCLRSLSDLVGAAESYRTAERVAERSGDMMGVLQARLGDAQIAITRGNLPAAEAILDEAIREASGSQMVAIKSKALHDRAGVAQLRGDYELSVRLAYEALDGVESERQRDRILNDLAGAFYKLGVRTAARDAYLILAATAQEQYIQWLASIALMEIAADDHAEAVFEQYRRQLENQPLSPILRAQFEHLVGHGYRQLGAIDVAREWLGRALVQAQALELHQLAFEIEAELPLVRIPVQSSRAITSYEVGGEVGEIAGAVSEIRRLAEVPG